jgi:hypothetical protein
LHDAAEADALAGDLDVMENFHRGRCPESGGLEAKIVYAPNRYCVR